MMIQRMRNISALLSFAFLAFVISSCAQPTGPVASGDRSFGAGSHSVVDIPTPSFTSATASGSTIDLAWSNGGTAGNETSVGEYWGTTQSSMKENSGHTDVFMWNGVTNSWDELGSSTTGTYQLTNMADGIYSFKVKEKSNEGVSPNQMTHHSEDSEPIEVTVSSCTLTYNVSSISDPVWTSAWDGTTGTNPSYTPTFDQNGMYVSGGYQVVVFAVGTGTGSFTMKFNLAATCDGVADGRNDVTAQVYDGATAIGSAVTTTWDGTKYVASNLTYPVGLGTWSIKVKVGGVDVMTPIELSAVCRLEYGAVIILQPGWNNSQQRGVNPNYSPSYDNVMGYYTGGFHRVQVAAASNNQGKVSLQLQLGATCSGNAANLANVTGQVFDGTNLVGTAQAATWDASAQKYIINNMPYPNGTSTSWCIKIKVNGNSIATPIQLYAN
jgi:hypothetical protein